MGAVGEPGATAWPWAARVGFRFCFCYFLLFGVVFTQILFLYTGFVTGFLSEESVLWQRPWLTAGPAWVGRHVFGVPVRLRLSESGDQAYIWVLVGCLLVVAGAATLVWTALARRTEYARLGAWFVLAARIALGTQLLWYGIAKLVPNQMPSPPLTTLLEPFGDFTRMEVLWNQIGIAPGYQMLLGAAEVLAAVLLLTTRTATLGALLALVCLTQVFVLNLAYDVPVKLFSFHLLLLSWVVLAPQARGLIAVLVLHRPAAPLLPPPVPARRLATVLPVLFGLLAGVTCVRDAWQSWHEWGYGAPKPALYGIWDVTEFSLDGRALPPLTTDEIRWQRLVVDLPGPAYQRMNGDFVPGALDETRGVLTLADTALTYRRPDPDHLILHGDRHRHQLSITLVRRDLADFRVRRPGFHWVQETLPRDP
ncbi:DoxX family protein [Nocardia sp. NPDC048505]|uniref:DoxX family protein n=1 Tax=unclassified Nocardia TaxID=2637762 RepID=UPI0033C1FFE7